MNIEDIKKKILASVYDLLEDEPVSKDELLRWYEKAQKVKSLMELDNGSLQVPHGLWHYLDDADIRLKDRRYAEAQILQIREVLLSWELKENGG